MSTKDVTLPLKGSARASRRSLPRYCLVQCGPLSFGSAAFVLDFAAGLCTGGLAAAGLTDSGAAAQKRSFNPGGLYSQCHGSWPKGYQPWSSPRRTIHLCAGAARMSATFCIGVVVVSKNCCAPADISRSAASPSECDEKRATAASLPAFLAFASAR